MMKSNDENADQGQSKGLTVNALRKLQENGAFSESTEPTAVEKPDTVNTDPDADESSVGESVQSLDPPVKDPSDADSEVELQESLELQEKIASQEKPQVDSHGDSQADSHVDSDEDPDASAPESADSADSSLQGEDGSFLVADQPHTFAAPSVNTASPNPKSFDDSTQSRPNQIELDMILDDSSSIDDEEMVSGAVLDEAWDELSALAEAKSLQAELRDVLGTADGEEEASLDYGLPRLQCELPTSLMSDDSTCIHDNNRHADGQLGSGQPQSPPLRGPLDDEPQSSTDDALRTEDQESSDAEGFSPVIPTVDDLLDDVSDSTDEPQHATFAEVNEDTDTDSSPIDIVRELASSDVGSQDACHQDEMNDAMIPDPSTQVDSENQVAATRGKGDDASESTLPPTIADALPNDPNGDPNGDQGTQPLTEQDDSDTILLQGDCIPVVRFGVEQKHTEALGSGQGESPESSEGGQSRSFDIRLAEQFARISCQTAVKHALSQIDGHCQKDNPKVFLLASVATTPKTAEAIGLMAMGLCAGTKSVLVVDADLSEQTLTRAYEALGQPGLCDVLESLEDAMDVARPTGRDAIQFVPCGDDVVGISRDRSLVPEGPLVNAIRRWQETFDCIVIDAGACENTLLGTLGQNSDVALLLVPYSHADPDQIKSASQRLTSKVADVAGCLLTEFPADGT